MKINTEKKKDFKEKEKKKKQTSVDRSWLREFVRLVSLAPLNHMSSTPKLYKAESSTNLLHSNPNYTCSGAQRTFPLWSSGSSQTLWLRPRPTMAHTLAPPTLTILIYSLIGFSLFHKFASASASSKAFHGSDSRRRPMVLPLYLSSPKSTSHRREFEGRRLQKSDRPNARMRLYDDLLSNGFFFLLFPFIIMLNLGFFMFYFLGLLLMIVELIIIFNRYYTTRLWIGTPPQKFALIVDTGSTVTYVPCSDCEQCGRHQVWFPLPLFFFFSGLIDFYGQFV